MDTRAGLPMPAIRFMRHSSENGHETPAKTDELDLDLPALDGEGEEPTNEDFALVPEAPGANDGLDPFDDATGESLPHEDLTVEGAETGWLEGAETASALDIGAHDLTFETEGKVLEDDEPDARSDGLDDLVDADEAAFGPDAGEEGPLAEDEELREEDLPALDADEEGDVPDEHLFDRGLISGDDDLRWDDRAWTRAMPIPATVDDADDSGILAIPGDDAAQSARDVVWRRLEESGRAMAAAFLPGDSVVVALSTRDRARALLVRIQHDGETRIIAEMDPRVPASTHAPAVEDDGEPCVVTFMRWDATRGCLFVGGNFGVEAYRPL